jgi:hypothetical protein
VASERIQTILSKIEPMRDFRACIEDPPNFVQAIFDAAKERESSKFDVAGLVNKYYCIDEPSTDKLQQVRQLFKRLQQVKTRKSTL